ncbi:MAG TPA: NADH-quinone oxidoreductase subunit C [Longimicrobiales bacterium]|nr:NADH-quinone oxidoreductase subunit C [Longimicrobiales bacterium]
MEKGFEKGLEGLARGPEFSDQPETAVHAASDVSHPSVTALREKFGDVIGQHVLNAGDEHVVYVNPSRSFEVLKWLRETHEHQYDLCKDITAIDYGGNRPLELFYELWSIKHKRQLRVKVVLPLDQLEVDSAVPIWQTANWLEREVYDLFGINFRNHPDMRRIMMPENYAEGHPLRKDFPLRGRFTRAEQTRRALSMEVEDFYTPNEMDVGGVSESSDAHGVSNG